MLQAQIKKLAPLLAALAAVPWIDPALEDGQRVPFIKSTVLDEVEGMGKIHRGWDRHHIQHVHPKITCSPQTVTDVFHRILFRAWYLPRLIASWSQDLSLSVWVHLHVLQVNAIVQSLIC